MKPFSQACENNKDPILGILRRVFAECKQVLEIGSGTGQHAVYFAANLAHLHWQCSDLAENHAGINQWLDEADLPNVARPIALNADDPSWPVKAVDAVFSANTAHIMSWPQVQNMFGHLQAILTPGAVVAVYGPFNYNGNYTSESNLRFDGWLKSVAPHQGIRDFEAVNELARNIGLQLLEDNAMPANNRLIVWQNRASAEET